MRLLLLLLLLFAITDSYCQNWKKWIERGDSLTEVKLFKESAAAYETALPFAEQEFGKESDNYLRTRNSLARSMTLGGRKQQGKKLLLENIDLCRGKANERLYADALYNAGWFFLREKKFDNSLGHLKEAAKIYKRVSGDNSIEYAEAVNALARSYANIGLYNLAEPLYLETLEIRKKVFGEKHPEYAESTNSLGILYKNMGKYSVAESYYLKTLELRKELYGEKHIDYAHTLNNLAILYRAIGNYPAAEPLYKQALEIKRELLGTDHPSYAVTLNALAVFYRNIGNYPAAEAHYQEALKIKKQVFGEKHPDYAISLNNLGYLYEETGNFQAAEQLYLQALRIKKETLGERNPEYLSSLQNLGVLYKDMGNFSSAKKVFEEVLKVRKETYGEEHTYYASTLHYLAQLNELTGDYKNALIFYDMGLKIRKAVFGNKHPEVGESLYSKAELALKMGDFSAARPLVEESLDVFAASLGKSHKRYAESLGLLAIASMKTGKEREAKSMFLQVLNILKESVGDKHPSYVKWLNTCADSYWLAGEYEKSLLIRIQVKDWALGQVKTHFPYLSEVEKERFFEHNVKPYIHSFSYFSINDSKKSREFAADLYDIQLETKAILLNASAKWKSNILTSGDKRLLQQFLSWENLRSRINTLYSASEIDKRELSQLEEEANLLEKQLSLLSERFNKKFQYEQLQWEDVRQKLNKGEAAIEVVRIQKFGKGSADSGLSQSASSSFLLSHIDSVQYAFLIIQPENNTPDLILLNNGKAMERQLSFYRNAIKFRVKDDQSFSLLFQPVYDHLKKNKISKIYFSPDGLYHQLNLKTLFNPRSEKYLCDELAIHQVTNTKDLLVEDQVNITNKYAIVMGVPQFEEQYAELPGVRKEIEMVYNELLEKEWEAELKEGVQVNEKDIKDLYNPKLLHIATHGYFEAKDYLEESAKAQGARKNPLWHSGLVVSKTVDELSAVTNDNDGLLTAYEAMNLNLDGTEVVVLSACDTGLGEVKYGEGVYGLQRAFMVAGAKNVIMSLWKINDEVTQKLMTLFYENFTISKDAREALTSAQNEIRQSYSDPYYWGAFVLVGR
jgi:tetratricopeptide (TPR) repeat protein